jgi:hypothetical protein
MRILVAAVLMASLAACRGSREASAGPPVTLKEHAFTEGFRASRYLDEAIRLQGLGETERTSALRELARDVRRASDVFPLCRMLLVAREGREFRRPLLGGAVFIGRTGYADWPLEPITIHKGLPILVVRGYELGGSPEPPPDYVEYCLAAADWNPRKFVALDREARLKLMWEFIYSRSLSDDENSWLLAQAV